MIVVDMKLIVMPSWFCGPAGAAFAALFFKPLGIFSRLHAVAGFSFVVIGSIGVVLSVLALVKHELFAVSCAIFGIIFRLVSVGHMPTVTPLSQHLKGIV